MHTAANINLNLIDCSSFERLADLLGEPNHGRFYQQLASQLHLGVHTRQVWNKLGDGLVMLAEQAHALRQMDALQHFSEILVSAPLPQHYKAAGRYYQALCIHRFGRGDLERAANILEQVAETAPPRYRARALVSLGANSYRKGDNQLALSLYREASRFLSRSGLHDPHAHIHAQRTFARINSEQGNRDGAVALLEGLFPAAHSVRCSHPHLYHDYLNSLAVELCKVGRIEEASNISQVVLASPFARAYPEWRETSNEIGLIGRHPSRAMVAFRQKIPEAEDLPGIRQERVADDSAVIRRRSEVDNVVCLPVPERDESVAQSFQASEPGRLLSMQEWKKNMPKQSTGDSRDRAIPKPPNQERQDRIAQLRNMGSRELMLRLIEAVSEENIDDDLIVRAVIVLEGLDQSDENPGA